MVPVPQSLGVFPSQADRDGGTGTWIGDAEKTAKRRVARDDTPYAF